MGLSPSPRRFSDRLVAEFVRIPNQTCSPFARYIFPIDSPPIRDGLVAIDHDRIIAVGPANSPSLSDFVPAARDLGDVAILPGLVNPHTHLEFSDLSQPLGTPGMLIADWIRLVVASRRAESNSPDIDPIALGIAESTRVGVTGIGEIASTPWQRPGSLPLEVTQFCEFISLLALRTIGAIKRPSRQCRDRGTSLGPTNFVPQSVPMRHTRSGPS